ncbi:MAG: hypothetical protein GF353_00450 [Candidatus Lokiarchaeota archaeon]|nr:hypothetical protein [Candidatus Lokiarchaeota archaeon]
MPILLITLFGGLATHIYLATWVYKDLNRRYATHLKWPIFIFFTGIVGVLIYIALRREFVDHIQVFSVFYIFLPLLRLISKAYLIIFVILLSI